MGWLENRLRADGSDEGNASQAVTTAEVTAGRSGATPGGSEKVGGGGSGDRGGGQQTLRATGFPAATAASPPLLPPHPMSMQCVIWVSWRDRFLVVRNHKAASSSIKRRFTLCGQPGAESRWPVVGQWGGLASEITEGLKLKCLGVHF